MIVLVNPRATKPGFRRFPLSVMALGASLPEGTTWEIWDGNKPGEDFADRLLARVEAAEGTSDPVRLLAISTMPGPQLAAAVPLTKTLKSRFPKIPIVWGGYFPSLYPKPVGHAAFVDYFVRGQGERSLVELLEVLDGRRDASTVAGLGYRENGFLRLNAEAPWTSPNDLPSPPYDAIEVPDYLESTFLGRRTGVYQASIGCPYACNFCGVISVWGSRQKQEEPARTAANLELLVKKHGMDGLHFYDNNFFLGEAHAKEIVERITPLSLNWWCEARIDILLGYGDATWASIRRSGLKMVFFGAESGSDEALKKMSKNLTTRETLEMARRIREWGIVPEFSFVLGGPDDPAEEIDTTLSFIRKLKVLNPSSEIILYYYTPIPQRRGTYGGVDALEGTPEALEDWTHPEWIGWMTHESVDTPWMRQELKARVEDFELVLKSRFPSVHDTKTRAWGKALAKVLSRPPWEQEAWDDPRTLRRVRQLARIPKESRQLYGHLRPPEGA